MNSHDEAMYELPNAKTGTCRVDRKLVLSSARKNKNDEAG